MKTMKTIKIDDLKPDPLSAAQASTDKETVTVSGYICAVDKTTISVSENRDGTFHIECPRSAVIAAFTDEDTEQVTLLVEANAQIKTISIIRAEMIANQASEVGGMDCSAICKSCDCDTISSAEQEIPSGISRSRLSNQQLGLSDSFLRCYDICRGTGRGYYDCIRRCQIITRPRRFDANRYF